jgi:hypothetical protein
MPERLQPENFIVNMLQGIIFTPTTQITTSKVLGQILGRFADRFDGPPTVLPVPQDAPPEIPRVVLQSADPQWVAEVALSRVNFRWVQMKDDLQMKDTEFAQQFIEFVSHLVEIQKLRIGRLAYAATHYILTDDAALLFANQFCKEGVVQKVRGSLENFEIHVHQRKKIADAFDVNNWIRFKTGVLTIPKTPVRKIGLVEQDINTVTEGVPDRVFDTNDLRTFINAAIMEQSRTFRTTLEG